MRSWRAVALIVVAVSAAVLVSTPTYAEQAQAEAQAHTLARYSTTETRLGVLLDDPAARAVLQHYIPEIVSDWRIGMARSMTLKTLQPRTHGHLTDQDMAQIEVEFAALAPSQ